MPPTENPTTLRFDAADMALFSQVSHDVNPLHLSEAYARATPFGQRVVFGVLGALHCLGALPLEGQSLTGVTLEFVGPMLLGIDYTIARRALSPTRWLITLSDGTRPLVKATFRVGPGAARADAPEGEATAPRAEPADRDRDDFAAGETESGRYQVDGDALAQLMARTGVAGVATSQVAALLWSSYLVGMELPGRRALYNGLTLEFAADAAPAAPIDYTARVKHYDVRFGLLRTEISLEAGGAPLGKGEVRAFVRQAPRVTEETLPQGDALAGKTALVIGASRGLGARIAAALVGQGARVYASYLRSGGEMDALAARLQGSSGALIPVQGDGADPAWCASTLSRIAAETDGGGLDILVCNACPPILPMFFDTASAARTARYVADSLDLVGVPLAASLESLTARQGWAVVLSSVYAEKAPPNFPHYVAAKCAIEGLVQSVAHHYGGVGFLLVRPPRLEGELNIPFGGEVVLPAGQVAATIAHRLAGERPSGEAALLTEFSE